MSDYSEMQALLKRYLGEGKTLGLIGVGNLGGRLREIADSMSIRVLLCDPPRNLEEAEELGESFFGLWGNGMGGCTLTNEGMETFVPLDAIATAEVIAIQVPVVNDGRFPTVGMISHAFMSKCRPDAVVLCFSDKAVIASEVHNDSRIVYL